MSAESTLVFYGLKFTVSDEEITSVEERRHPKMVEARKNGLKCYWGNFSKEGNKYLLFIGENLGIMGFENEAEIEIRSDELIQRMKETDEKLSRAGFAGDAKLFIEWEPDA